MHVKVKVFVQDVKRKFSQKRKRKSCSTCSNLESHDGTSSDSSSDTHHDRNTRVSTSSSSIASLPERGRLDTFVRPRTESSSSVKHYQKVLQKVRRLSSRHYRPFSSERAESAHPAGRRVQWSPLSIQDVDVEYRTIGSLQNDYSDVFDISAQSDKLGFAEGSVQSMSHDTQFHKESCSDVSGTLVSTSSHEKSILDSDAPFGINLHSDRNPIPVHDIHPMSLPPAPPSKHHREHLKATFGLREEQIISSATLDKSTATPSMVPQVSRTVTPAQSTRSIPESPAPVCIPRLTAPSMFLPIPNTDPLSPLLTKHVPAEQRPRRDIVGEYAGRDVHEMVMLNSWRALAKMARDRIVASDPEDLGRILDLWSLRLSSLARLRLTNQASAECTNLFAVLNAVPPVSVPGSFPGSGSLPLSVPLPSSPAPAASSPLSPSGLSGLAQLPGTPSQKSASLPPLPTDRTTPAMAVRPEKTANELVHPFELIVFHARVHYWSGDPLGYVDALCQILGQCKERAREEARVVVQRREMREAVGARCRGDVDDTNQSERTNEGGGKEDDEATEEIAESGEIQDEDEPDDVLVAAEANLARVSGDMKGTGDSGRANEENDEVEDQEDTEATEESAASIEAQDENEPDGILVAAEANLSMWLERIARVCLILASQMIEMNGYQAAINLLVPLCTHRVPPTFVPTPSPELHSALARAYLLSGNLQKAEAHFSIAASAAGNGANGADIVAMNTALLAAASGDWTRAEQALRELVAKDPENFTAVNNLAVTLLCQGRIKEGINLLEGALRTSPSSVVVAEPFLFNLSTLYELRSTAAIDKKCELLIEVAKWSGDGLKTSCLKMPSS